MVCSKYFFISSRNNYIKLKDRIGTRPKLIEIEKIKSFDIVGLKISKSETIYETNIKINEKKFKICEINIKKIKSDYFEITENFAHDGNLYITFEFYFKKLLGKYFFLKKNKNLKIYIKTKELL